MCSSEQPRPFPKLDDKERANIHYHHKKIFFSRTTGPISTNLGTKHYLMKGILVCSNDGPRPFPILDNKEIAKFIDET